MMKNCIRLFLAYMVSFGGISCAVAEEEPFAKENFSGTFAITTDYVFRGISFSGEETALQGSFDWGYGNWFAGVWGSSIKGEDGVAETNGYELELDYYVGYADTFRGFDWYVMPVYYHFPGANDAFSGAETDQFEIMFNAARTVTLGDFVSAFELAYAYTPDYTLEDGNGHYVKGVAALLLQSGFSVDAALGYQYVEGDRTTSGFNYAHWEFGVSKTALGFDFDLRYHDTDEGDDLLAALASDIIGSRIVFTVSRSF